MLLAPVPKIFRVLDLLPVATVLDGAKVTATVHEPFAANTVPLQVLDTNLNSDALFPVTVAAVFAIVNEVPPIFLTVNDFVAPLLPRLIVPKLNEVVLSDSCVPPVPVRAAVKVFPPSGSATFNVSVFAPDIVGLNVMVIAQLWPWSKATLLQVLVCANWPAVLVNLTLLLPKVNGTAELLVIVNVLLAETVPTT